MFQVRGVRDDVWRGRPIRRATGPRIRSHMAVWRPNWSAVRPIRKGKNFASGAVTELIAMVLALWPGRLEYNRPCRIGYHPVFSRFTRITATSLGRNPGTSRKRENAKI